MSEKKNRTNNVGALIADNQNVITTGSGFCAHKMVRHSSNDPPSLPLLPKSIDTSAKIK